MTDVFASVRRPLEMRPWPAQPLCAAIDVDGEMSLQEIAREADATWATFHRALTEGLTERQADEWAVAAGLHPAEVWGWAWFEAGSQQPLCELDTCRAPFTPTRRNQAFCQDRCKHTAKQRAYVARKRAAGGEQVA